MVMELEFSLERACQSYSYLTNLQEIVETHPNELARNFGMAIISSLDERNEESLQQLELLAEVNPNIPLVHQRIAEFCIALGRYEQAIVHLEKVIELENQNLTARFWLCLLYHLTNKTKQAKSSLDILKKLVYGIRVKFIDWKED